MLWHNMISKSMINKDIKNLTGVSPEDLTVLGQCWESSSHFLVPLPLLIHKMLLESYEEDIKQISPGTTNHHNPYGDFCRHSLKRVSIHFHPCHLLTDDIAYEQALLFGRAKRAAGERASERRSACLSRVYFSRYPLNGELARRLQPSWNSFNAEI